MTDYYGVDRSDYGYTIMGVKNGKPYFMNLGWSYDKSQIKKYLKAAQFLI